MCKISVLMGVHNGQRFLKEAVDSVLCQTFVDFELLICNDGSTDATAQILEEYARQDSRVRILENEKNMGLAASLNRCIEEARGEYLARMDADDRCLPERFARQVEYLDSHMQVAVVGSGAYLMDDSSRIYGQRGCGEEAVITLADAVKAAPLIHPTVMMRAHAVRAVDGYTVNALTTRAEDYDLWCKLCQAGYVLARVPEKLLCYREDSANVSRRKYRYRIQEAQLKNSWRKRANMPLSFIGYAVKPLIVGLLPLSIYRVLHRKQVQPVTEEA